MMNRSLWSFALGGMMLVACVDPDAGQATLEQRPNLAPVLSIDGTVAPFTDHDLDSIVASSTSFYATCRQPFFLGWNTATGAITEARAGSCQMRNGLWTGETRYVGYCTGDVSNCNGGLQCGGPCP